VWDFAALPDFARARLCLRKRDRAGQKIAVDHVIDDAGGLCRRGRHRFAVGAHLERARRAAQPRQTLRTAGARNDAEQHFGLSDFGILRRHAEVACLRHFEAAAERVAVNRRNERLGRVLDTLEHRMRLRRSRQRVLARAQRVEYLDVRAGDERGSSADEDDRVGRRID
jgi:hypothetical protein